MSCSVETGFTVSVVEKCRAEQYAHLTDLTGLFAQEKDLSSSGGAKPDDLDSKCSFDADGKAVFGFKTCGTATHSVEKDYTYFTTYINHQVKMGKIVTSHMDQNELHCQLL